MLSQSTLIKICIGESRKSDHQHRLGAVIYSKNIILSRNHNYSLKSAKKLHPRFHTWPGSIHAEMSCILSARCDLVGSSMFIIRINKQEKLMMAMPCNQCMAYILYTGIKRVTYSTGDGFVTINLR